MKVLVTGSEGFVGQYLVQELLKRNHTVYAGVSTIRNRKYINPKIHIIKIDITNEFETMNGVKEIKPDAVIHLAAQSNIKKSWDNPGQTYLINIIGTVNLIQAMAEYSPNTKIITIGSSEEYGATALNNPVLFEEMECKPQNPYAISKHSAYLTANLIASKYNLKYIHVRPFNHIGPGQQKGFVVSDFASQIVSIEKGKIEPIINVGNIDVSRDFLDVRDVIEAYILLLENDVENGVYNISSEIPTSISDILSILIQFSGIDIKIRIDKNKFRPTDVKSFCGSSKKIKNSINWIPKLSLNKTLLDTLNWWRKN